MSTPAEHWVDGVARTQGETVAAAGQRQGASGGVDERRGQNASAMRDAAVLLGLGLVVAGAVLVCPPAGLIGGGLVLVALTILSVARRRGRRALLQQIQP